MVPPFLDLNGPADRSFRTTRAGGKRQFRIANLLRFALALLIAGNVARLPVLDGGGKEAAVLLNDLLVVLVVGAGAAAILQSRRMVLDRPAVMALLFASVGGFSALLAVPRFGLTGFQFFFSIAYLVRWLVYFGVYVVVINCLRSTDVPKLWGVLETVILIFAAFGIFQAAFLPGFAQIVHPGAGWDVQGHRLVSTFLDPNFAGGLIMIGLLIVLARVSFAVRTPAWKPLVLFLALLLTLSRSSMLAFIIGTAVIVAVRGLSRRLLLFAVAVALVVLALLPVLLDFAVQFNRFSVQGSASLRIVSWLQALEVIRDYPLLGIGFNTYGYVQKVYGHVTGTDSHYFTLDGGLLFVTVMTGLVGLSLYTGMIGLVLARCRRLWKTVERRREDRALGLGIAAATVAIVVHSIFLNSLLMTLLMEPLWVLWGATYLLLRADLRETAAAPPLRQRDAPPAPVIAAAGE